MADAADAGAGAGSTGRAPRLPRWTRQEILVLIQGKKAVESRGRGRAASTSGGALVVSGGGAVEPKWTVVSAYCRRRGVIRGPMQCRKRWSNLASDFKKIKEWEGKGKESFWAMRNDVRRENRLPGFFDREVYDILDGAASAATGDEEAVFDSGRTVREDGLFSDFEEKEEEEEEEEIAPAPVVSETPAVAAVVVALPISEKKYEPPRQESAEQATLKDKQPAGNPERGSSPSSQDGHKRRRIVKEGDVDSNIQAQLVQVLEKNNKMLIEHLKAQNTNSQLDREERKEQASSLLGVLNKLADALGRIADKLK